VNDRHAALYLFSRIFAAGLNLVSLAVFTRLAPPDVFGRYLIGFATGFIVYGTAFQWLLHAHFGVYASGRAARLAGALIALCLMAALPLGLLLAVLIMIGLAGLSEGFGVAVLVIGLVVHIGAIEIGRAQLLVGQVTAASLLRGVLMLAFGSAALWAMPSAPNLLVAIGIAHVLAALPVLAGLRGTIWQGGFVLPERGDLVEMVRYGWPLILALAGMALAMNLDRIVLEGVIGAEAVAPYGAVSDLIRQSFVVLGEAIAAAYISQAKAGQADMAASRAARARAFVTLWVIVMFGLAGFALFGPDLIGLLLAPGYGEAMLPAMPLLLAGTACLVLRAYYFGQIIYFSDSPQLELLASAAMVGVAVVSCWVLVPAFGMVGGGGAFAVTQGAGLAVFVIADRRSAIMPVDTARALWTAGAAGAVAVIGAGLMTVPGGALGWMLAFGLTMLVGGGFVIGWNLFDFGRLAGRVLPSKAR
jgi:O-antigen/teichoic acid export membrane protein